MYSVLIVDDEEPVLDSYSYMVRNSDLDLTLCGAARSGIEALELARQNHPDIVVMDIAMPGIDGLDTIKELQKAYPETLYILSTAYERFDLAQRAIPLRVFAYLVKPVSRRRFLETLREAAESLHSRREELSHRLEEVQSAAEVISRETESFLLQITWKALEADHWERYRRLFQLTSDQGRVVVLDFSHLPAGYDREGAARRITERLEHRYRILCKEYFGRLLIFINGDSSGLDPFVQRSVTSLLPGEALPRIGIGDERTYREFFLSYDRALLELSGGTGSAGTILPGEDALNRCRYDVARGRDADQVYQRCRTWWEGEFARISFPLARARMIAFFTLLLEDLSERIGRSRAQLVTDRIGDPALAIMGIQTRAEWDAWAGRALRLIVEERAADSAGRMPLPLQKAIAYVDEHLREAIQLSWLAEYCQVSVGYLSRLFSDHLDTTFNDYLNKQRIDVAERYLKEGRLSVKEIAYAAGYRDPNYFSRIFKKYRGLSPSSYFVRKEVQDE